MRKLVLAGLAFGALIMPAMAADMTLYRAPPPAPYFTWTGFYFGGDVGGAFSSDSAAWSVRGASVSATGDTGGSAFAGGLFAGYNFQIAPTWVVGIEGDWTGMRAGGAFNQPWNAGGVVPGTLTSMSSEVEWAASIRGRLGYLIWPNLLVYGTGGGAWGKIQYGDGAFAPLVGGPPAAAYSAGAAFITTSGGWVAGGGLEWAPFAGFGLLLRLEYLYYDFSSAQNVVAGGTGPGAPASVFTWTPTTVNVARFGMSYKF
jgi:outer membrane immunogenic protein